MVLGVVLNVPHHCPSTPIVAPVGEDVTYIEPLLSIGVKTALTVVFCPAWTFMFEDQSCYPFIEKVTELIPT